jgi:hypothetical protein
VGIFTDLKEKKKKNIANCKKRQVLNFIDVHTRYRTHRVMRAPPPPTPFPFLGAIIRGI